MADPGGLPFDPDGYLDLSAFPDGDPDAVLEAGGLGSLQDAIAADRQSDGDVDPSFVDGLLDGNDDGTLDDLIPTGDGFADDLDLSESSMGPFDLSEYTDHETMGDDTDTDDGHDDAGEDGGGGASEGSSDSAEDGSDLIGFDDYDLDPAAYDDGVGDGFDEASDDSVIVEEVVVFEPVADHGWEADDDPIAADSFDGLKDDEWGNG